ncbi:MAG: hypothetical protein L3K17_00135 [Thermoplasmata archaeon]|nr:hypothetical protein [Thermoplasmata archaeon]
MARHATPHPPETGPPRRSNAAAPIAGVVLLAGLILGAYTVVVPALLGLFLISSSLSFLSTRVNPLSIGFYLNTKPSWMAIGLLFLCGLTLLGAAYGYYVSGFAPIVPG